MSYHQTYRNVSSPLPGSFTHSPAPSIQRKPANYASSLRSESPMRARDLSVGTTVSDLRSPSPLTPLNSNPPNLPMTPSRTPDAEQQDQDRPLYQPTALTAVTNNSLQPNFSTSTPATAPAPAPAPIPAQVSTNRAVPVQPRPPSPDRPLYGAPSPSPAPTSYTSHNLPAPRKTPSTTSSRASPADLKPLTRQEIDEAFKHCLRLQSEAVSEHNKKPFAALLLSPNNTTILASHMTISPFQPAVAELARLAATQYDQSYLARCTLVSTWEPCALGAGTIYWTGIGRVLYAATELKLADLIGSNPEYPVMNLPCRNILNAGSRKVEVIGPIGEWEVQVVEDAARYWQNVPVTLRSSRDTASTHSKRTSITVYNPEESLLGSIGEDGEYQADLKIDWMM